MIFNLNNIKEVEIIFMLAQCKTSKIAFPTIPKVAAQLQLKMYEGGKV